VQGLHEVNNRWKKQSHRLVMKRNQQDKRGKPSLEGTIAKFDTNEKRLQVPQLIVSERETDDNKIQLYRVF